MTSDEHAGRARSIFEVMLKVVHASGSKVSIELTETDWQWVVWSLGVAHEVELQQARQKRAEER